MIGGSKQLENVAQLNKCQALQSLDLSANPITEILKYRDNVFEKLGSCKSLEALDGFTRGDSEWSLEDKNELVYDQAANNGEYLNQEREWFHDHFYLMRKDGSSSEGTSEE